MLMHSSHKRESLVEQELMEAAKKAKKGKQSEGSGEAPSEKEVSVPFMAD